MDFAWPVDAGSDFRIAALRLTTTDHLGDFVPAANNGVFISTPITFGTNGWHTASFNISTLNDAGFAPYNGKTPVIMIRNSSTEGALYFDNLRGETTATYTPVPEPTSIMLLAGLAGAMTLRRRG